MAPRRARDVISAIFSPRHPYLPGTEILRQVDIDALSDRLDLSGRAQADGKVGAPPADGRSLSLTEREIQSELRRLWEETVAGARRAHDAYRGRFASLGADTDLEELLGEPKAVTVTLKQGARDERDRLIQDYAQVREARAELARFRRRERIERPPAPDQTALVKVALLAFAALIELIVNTSIFAGGDEFGFVGAITKVVIIPIVNIGGCWLLTHWLARHVLGRAAWGKAVGLLGVVLTGLWLFGLNLAVAHWRDEAAAAMSADAARFSLAGALAHPFQLRSFQSWGLFLVGCFAGVIAIFEGWTWTDPHPGYGRRARHAREAAREWTAARASAIEHLHLIAQENIAALKEAQRRAELATAERPDLAVKVESLREDLAAYAGHLRWVGDELARRYREANLTTREGTAPPQFDTPLDLTFDVPNLAALTTDPARRVVGRFSRAIADITAALDAACSTIPLLGDMEGEGAR